MPKHFSDDQYGQAVFGSVQSGAYPESEELVSAELPSSALPGIIKLIENAREDVKITIKGLSKQSAPDVDGWISQAKQLRKDIEHSKEQSKAIVNRAKDGQQLQDQVSDATAKVHLLRNEVAFNGSLATTMKRILAVRQTLDRIKEAILSEDLLEAAESLDHGSRDLESLRECQNTGVAGLLGMRLADLHQDVVTSTEKRWNGLICITPERSKIKIKQQLGGSHPIDLHKVTQALLKLGVFEPSLRKLCQDINRVILIPRLNRQAGYIGSLHIDGDDMWTSQGSPDASLQALFSDICSVVDFLRTRLPPVIVTPLSGLLMPNLISGVISTWLSSAVPIDLDGMQEFQETVDLVLQFGRDIRSYQWQGMDDLVTWAKGVPRVWLEKRRETSLDGVRKVLSKGFGTIKAVERVETQVLSQDDDVLAAGGGNDEWNAEWSDEESKDSSRPTAEHGGGDGEEEDVSAWGLDDETHDQDTQKALKQIHAANDDTDAWGWGDDVDIEETSNSVPPALGSTRKHRLNGHADAPAYTEREVTLKETYKITSLPSEILDIIVHVMSDAETLKKPNFAKLPIASAAAGLHLVPGLVLSMYRASASSHYSRDINGSMFLYNDSLWMSESLRHIAESRKDHSWKSKLEADVSALENFGKRAYGKEMESQRTIIGDLLDGAQGFANCTEPPFAQECDLAISSVVDRLRDIHKQWKTVLSHSALLQSLGSLLSTVINKVIVDVCDMSDISEPESQRLTAFCNRIAALEDLFTPEPPQDGPSNAELAVPLTAVYTPNWLRFQYLSQILDSTLVDIKYLWTEGELRLEFSVDELVDLIQALFADSEHRRRAIAEIRRS